MQKTSSRLLSLLQTHRDWSGEALAQRLDITSRAVRRDIDRLRELGYPITTVKGPAGGYRLEAGTHLPPMLFDDDQAVALAVALQTAAIGTTVAEDATRALATLRQVMPPAYATASTCCASPPSNRPRPATPLRSTLRSWWT